MTTSRIFSNSTQTYYGSYPPAQENLLQRLNFLLNRSTPLIPLQGTRLKAYGFVNATDLIVKHYDTPNPPYAECIGYLVSKTLKLNLMPETHYVAADSESGKKLNDRLSTNTAHVIQKRVVPTPLQHAVNEEECVLFRWIVGCFDDNNFMIDAQGRKWVKNLFSVGGELFRVDYDNYLLPKEMDGRLLNVQALINLISALPDTISLNNEDLEPLRSYDSLQIKIDRINANLTFLKHSIKLCKQYAMNKKDISFQDLVQAMRVVGRHKEGEDACLHWLEKSLKMGMEREEYIVKGSHSAQNNSEHVAYALNEYLQFKIVPFNYCVLPGSKNSRYFTNPTQPAFLQKNVRPGVTSSAPLEQMQRLIFFTWIIGCPIVDESSGCVISDGKLWGKNLSRIGSPLKAIINSNKFYREHALSIISRNDLQKIMDLPENFEIDSVLYGLQNIPGLPAILRQAEANLKLLKQAIAPNWRLADRGFQVTIQDLCMTILSEWDNISSLYDPKLVSKQELNLLDKVYEKVIQAANAGSPNPLPGTVIITPELRPNFIEEYLTYEISQLFGLDLWPKEHLLFPGSKNYEHISKLYNQRPEFFRFQQRIEHFLGKPLDVESALKVLVFHLILGIRHGQTLKDGEGKLWLYSHDGIGQDIEEIAKILRATSFPHQDEIFAKIAQWILLLPEKIELKRREFSYLFPTLLKNHRLDSINTKMRQCENNLKRLKEAINKVYYSQHTYNFHGVLNELIPKVQPTISVPFRYGDRTLTVPVEAGSKLKDVCHKLCDHFAKESQAEPGRTLVRVLYRSTLLTRPENLDKNYFEFLNANYISKDAELQCLPLIIPPLSAIKLCAQFVNCQFPGFQDKFNAAEALSELRKYLLSAQERLNGETKDATVMELSKQLMLLRQLSDKADSEYIQAYLEILIQEIYSAYGSDLALSGRNYEQLIQMLAGLRSTATRQPSEQLSSGDQSVELQIQGITHSFEIGELKKRGIYFGMYIEQRQIAARLHGTEEEAIRLHASKHLFAYLNDELHLERLTDNEVQELLATAENFVINDLSFLCQYEIIARLSQSTNLTRDLMFASQKTNILRRALFIHRSGI